MTRLRVYAQLVRLPNLPAALADICLAALALAVQPPVGDLVDGFRFDRLVLLLIGSACLYCSGMVWNDYFDQEQDRRERLRGDRRIGEGREHVEVDRIHDFGTYDLQVDSGSPTGPAATGNFRAGHFAQLDGPLEHHLPAGI